MMKTSELQFHQKALGENMEEVKQVLVAVGVRSEVQVYFIFSVFSMKLFPSNDKYHH